MAPLGPRPGLPLDRKFFFASIILFAIVAVFHFSPALASNEWVYLIRPRRMADPDFLSQTVSGGRPPFTAFWGLGAALFLVFQDTLLVALVGRVMAWTFVLFALGRLARELGIGWPAYLFGVSLWFLSGQSLGAGEWVFGGVEQKVFAYGFLLLALTYLLQGRAFLAGLMGAGALAFHILVGGWGAMALSAAVILSPRLFDRRALASFLACVGIVGLPLVSLALWSQGGGGASGTVASPDFDPIVFLVTFRNPHHLDPGVFFTAKKFLKLTVVAGCTLFAVRVALPREKGRVLLIFMAVSIGTFLAGLLAGRISLLSLLYFYPFRLADVLLPLFFWLVAIGFGWRTAGAWWRGRREGGSVPVTHLFVAVMILLTAFEMGRDAIPHIQSWGARTRMAWAGSFSSEPTDYEAVTSWIRGNTNPSSVVAASPCGGDFVLKAERAMVVNHKAGPSPATAYGWYTRLKALNGGHRFDTVGSLVCEELELNFNRLELEALREIRGQYSADYYLSNRERPELAEYLAHQHGTYHLYDLRNLGR